MAVLPVSRLSAVALSALLWPVCAAMVAFTNSDYSSITVGNPFAISWTGDGTEVIIQLLSGPASNQLQPIGTIAQTATSPYSWTPPTGLAQTAYAFSITQSGYTNYSPQFVITGGTGSSKDLSSTTGVATQSASPTEKEEDATPTPAYIVSGGLSTGNKTGAYGNGTGMVLPTGTNMPGQYEAFKGAAVRCGTWAGAMTIMSTVTLFLFAVAG